MLNRGMAWALLGLAACRPQTSPESPPASTSATPVAEESAPADAANREVGDVLDGTVLRYSGGELSLGTLKGQLVVFALALHEDGAWLEGFRACRQWEQRWGDQAPSVVLVAVDDAVEAMEAALLEGSSHCHVATDPMGASSARLQVAEFPTAFVVDPRGKIATIRRGPDWTRALEEDLERFMAPAH